MKASMSIDFDETLRRHHLHRRQLSDLCVRIDRFLKTGYTVRLVNMASRYICMSWEVRFTLVVAGC